MTKKKFLFSLTAVFFALLLLFTFVSKSVYNATLPVVTTVRTSKGSISQVKTLEGEFTYSETSKVTAQDTWHVTGVAVESGGRVAEGDTLFTIDVSDYRIQRHTYSGDLQKITRQLAELDAQAEADRTANARKKNELIQQKKYLQFQIQNVGGIYPAENYTGLQRQNQKKGYEMELLRVENSIAELAVLAEQAEANRERTRQELESQQSMIYLEIEELERRYPASGIIRASESGVVDSVSVKEGEDISKGAECLTMHSSQSDLLITFILDVNEGENFQKLSTINVEYPSLAWDEVRRQPIMKTSSKLAKDDTRKLEEDGEHWKYKAVMQDAGAAPPLNRHAKVTISSTGGFFENILPANCVKKDGEKEYVLVVQEKNSLFGKAYYVERVEVETKAKSSTQVAVTSKDYIGSYEIVETTTLPVYSGMTVLVR